MSPSNKKFHRLHRILCIRSDRIGEFLLMIPAIQLFKDSYPEVEITLIAQDQQVKLLKNATYNLSKHRDKVNGCLIPKRKKRGVFCIRGFNRLGDFAKSLARNNN